MKIMSLVDGVRDFWLQHGLRGSAGVIAVSGGPDSVALARILCGLQDEGVVGMLTLGHINHQLRASDSAADEAFVRSLPEQWQRHERLPCQSVRLDVRARADATGDNLEQAARHARYDWLAEVARTAGALWVATGHTAADQAETVLHRLLRGSGLRGLGGMPPRRQLVPGIELVRPLLTVGRAEVLAYLHEHGQTFCEDRSNLDLRFTRNRIRHELLPLLSQVYNPAIVDALCRLAEQARADYASVEQDAAQLLAASEQPRAGNVLVFECERLESAPRNLLREMFRLVWLREGWATARMGFDHWDRLAEVLAGRVAVIELPGRIRVERTRRVLRLEKR